MKRVGLTFNELSYEYKQALVEYMYMDLEEVRVYFEKHRFTEEWISIEEAINRCMTLSADLEVYESFADYHESYFSVGDVPNHGDSMYPVIEGGDWEWLLDGWHRFHSYVRYGKTEIPVLRIE